MKYQVVLLKSAELDLCDLRTYLIKNFGADVWRDSLEKIKAAIGNLKSFPVSGVVPDVLENLNLAQYRQVLAGQNRIIYEVRGSIVFIHIVADTRRDMKTLLTRRLLRAETCMRGEQGA
jgi:plasmid stabilization system protein ParE